MMFYDGSWDSAVADAQSVAFATWLKGVGRLVILEFGAGHRDPRGPLEMRARGRPHRRDPDPGEPSRAPGAPRPHRHTARSARGD